MSYFDYRFKFTDLSRALGMLVALRTAGVLGAGELPDNMLGDPRNAAGVIQMPKRAATFCFTVSIAAVEAFPA